MLLSIIIPIYNVEKYVRKTLESIFEQDVNAELFEVVIVNDGTPDNSMDIVHEFASRYSNITIINQKNQGLSKARNVGIENAKGDYVWFVDSDDCIEDGFIGKGLNTLNNVDADVFVFKIRHIEEDGKVRYISDFPDNDKITYCTGVEAFEYTTEYNFYLSPAQTFIIKKNYLTENGIFFFEGIMHEDLEIAPRLILSTEKVAIIPIVSYCYVWRKSGSITSSKKNIKKRLKSYLTILDNYKNFGRTLKYERERQILHTRTCVIMRSLIRLASDVEYEYLQQELHIDSYLKYFREEAYFLAKYQKNVLSAAVFYLFSFSPSFTLRIINKFSK